jgi:hypothetical protein
MMEKLIETHAREDARRFFLKTVTQNYIGNKVPSNDEFDMLRRLLHPVKDSIVSEETEHGKVENVLRKTEEVWKWVLGNIPAPGGKEAAKQ